MIRIALLHSNFLEGTIGQFAKGSKKKANQLPASLKTQRPF